MKKTIDNIDLRGKTVLIREDLNVPMNGNTITSNTRIVASLPTIQKAINDGAKVVVLSHLGRVKEAKDLETKSLKPVAKELSSLLNRPVQFIGLTKGREVVEKVKNLKHGEVLLLENTRFEDLNNKAESKNNEELAKFWASLGDVFINDAFATSHREHASNVGIAENIKESALGYLVDKEVDAISKAIDNPRRPKIAIIGGAKISDKIKTIEFLAEKVDKILLGAGMSFTFLKSQGISIGDSIFEPDQIEFARGLLNRYGNKIVLPIDFALSETFENTIPTYNSYNSLEIPSGMQGLDIGPKTIKLFENELKGAKTVIWNGPLGVCEFENYSKGTEAVAKAIGNLHNAYSIVGGGDSIAAINKLGLQNKFSHISTGGGACLAMLEGQVLPGIKAIQDASMSEARANMNKKLNNDNLNDEDNFEITASRKIVVK